MRTPMSAATLAHSHGVASARGEMSITAAAARIAGRTYHGPIGLNRSATAVSRSDASWSPVEDPKDVFTGRAAQPIEGGAPDDDADARDRPAPAPLASGDLAG